MDVKDKLEVNSEEEKVTYPSDIEEANIESLDYDIINKDKYIVTKKACDTKNGGDRCIICNQKIGEEHDVNCETIRKVIGITLLDWFQISVPNYLNEEDINNKAESISAAVYNFLEKYLFENEKENFIDVGGDIRDFEITGVPYLNEDIKLSVTSSKQNPA